MDTEGLNQLYPSTVATLDNVDIGMIFYVLVEMGTGPLLTKRAITGVGRLSPKSGSITPRSYEDAAQARDQ